MPRNWNKYFFIDMVKLVCEHFIPDKDKKIYHILTLSIYPKTVSI